MGEDEIRAAQELIDKCKGMVFVGVIDDPEGDIGLGGFIREELDNTESEMLTLCKLIMCAMTSSKQFAYTALRVALETGLIGDQHPEYVMGAVMMLNNYDGPKTMGDAPERGEPEGVRGLYR